MPLVEDISVPPGLCFGEIIVGKTEARQEAQAGIPSPSQRNPIYREQQIVHNEFNLTRRFRGEVPDRHCRGCARRRVKGRKAEAESKLVERVPLAVILLHERGFNYKHRGIPSGTVLWRKIVPPESRSNYNNLVVVPPLGLRRFPGILNLPGFRRLLGVPCILGKQAWARNAPKTQLQPPKPVFSNPCRPLVDASLDCSMFTDKPRTIT